MEQALATVGGGYDEVIDLAKYEKQGYTLLSPIRAVPRRINELYVREPIVVQINTNPNSGEVYRVGSKNVAPRGKPDKWENVLALTLLGARHLSKAYQVFWVETTRIDDRSNPRLVAYQKRGAYRDIDGKWVPLVGEAELDIDALEREVTIQQTDKVMDWEKFKKSKPYKERSWYQDWDKDKIIADMVDREMAMIEKHKEARCESKAEFRAIKSIGIPMTWLESELKKPIVVLAAMRLPDRTDDDAMRIHRRALAYDESALFGGRPQEFAGEEVPDAEFAEAVEEERVITGDPKDIETVEAEADVLGEEPPDPEEALKEPEEGASETEEGEESLPKEYTKAEFVQEAETIRKKLAEAGKGDLFSQTLYKISGTAMVQKVKPKHFAASIAKLQDALEGKSNGE